MHVCKTITTIGRHGSVFFVTIFQQVNYFVLRPDSLSSLTRELIYLSCFAEKMRKQTLLLIVLVVSCYRTSTALGKTTLIFQLIAGMRVQGLGRRQRREGVEPL